jgi:hypothetical protein
MPVRLAKGRIQPLHIGPWIGEWRPSESEHLLRFVLDVENEEKEMEGKG